ncbi:DUF6110 family protein [Hutsoniella sourekii]
MIDLKHVLKGSKSLGLFAGGALTASVASKLLASKDAKKLYANVIAKGLHVADEVNATVSNIKQGAEDVYEDAKDIYAEEKLANALDQLESVKADDDGQE